VNAPSKIGGAPEFEITLVMDHDTRPAETIPCIWYDSGSIESQPFRGEMGGDDIAIVGFTDSRRRGSVRVRIVWPSGVVEKYLMRAAGWMRWSLGRR
jgi:hypothetical protein